MKMQTAYQTCMNTTAIMTTGVEPLVNLLTQVTKAFPLSDEDYENPKNLTKEDYKSTQTAYAMLGEMGVQPFYTTAIFPNPKDPSYFIPSVAPAAPSASELGAELVQQIFAILLPPALQSSAKALATSLVEFDTMLAAVYPGTGLGEEYQDLYALSTFENVTALLPALDVPKYLTDIAPASAETGDIIFPWPEVAAATSQILLATPKPAIQAYFLWQVIMNFYTAVDSEELATIKALLDPVSILHSQRKANRPVQF